MTDTSFTKAATERWTKILDKGFSGPHHRTAKERLGAYLASLSQGREFGEDSESYLERKGYTNFYNWGIEQVNS